MASNDQNDDGHDAGKMAHFGDAVDIVTFSQILEMDDSEEDREFSRSIVFGFFEQADETFTKMDTALENKNLFELSMLGHFLKGSSATLGLNKVKDSCEKIQRYGKKENEDGTAEPDEDLCLARITETLGALKEEFDDVKGKLEEYFQPKHA